MGNIHVRTLLARVWADLDYRNSASRQNIRDDIARWYGTIVSRAFVFRQTLEELVNPAIKQLE
jgi:hypothetical protein